jgi:hypothetical protein
VVPIWTSLATFVVIVTICHFGWLHRIDVVSNTHSLAFVHVFRRWLLDSLIRDHDAISGSSNACWLVSFISRWKNIKWRLCSFVVRRSTWFARHPYWMDLVDALMLSNCCYPPICNSQTSKSLISILWCTKMDMKFGKFNVNASSKMLYMHFI